MTTTARALIDAARNALVELRNMHREYLAGQHGGCPCLTTPQHEGCALDSAIRDLEAALHEEETEIG